MPGDVTREVALKAIPKKKVKGNEEIVWSEMRVLQGLDHASSPYLFSMVRLCVRVLVYPLTRLVIFL